MASCRERNEKGEGRECRGVECSRSR
jgi:hypothetical protein